MSKTVINAPPRSNISVGGKKIWAENGKATFDNLDPHKEYTVYIDGKERGKIRGGKEDSYGRK